MNKDFLKFFDLSFKKFLTRTSILVAVVSFHTSFATDAPSGASSGLNVPRSEGDSPNRRLSGRGFGHLPPKKIESRAGDLIDETVSHASGHHSKVSERHSPNPDLNTNILSPSSQSGASSADESNARGSKNSSFLSFPHFTKKDEPASLSTSLQAGEDAPETSNAKNPSILSFAKFARKEDSRPPRISIDNSSISTSGDSSISASHLDGPFGSPRRESSEKRLRKSSHKQLTPEQRAAEELAGKEADERAKKLMENFNLKKAQEDFNLAQVIPESTGVGDESELQTQDNLDQNIVLKQLSSPRHSKKHRQETESPTSGTSTTSDIGETNATLVSAIDPISDPISVATPTTDLPQGLTDVETSNFYPTPKSRHTGSTTLVRRISSVIGNHLFVRSVEKAAAAGDAGSEPIKFGFWGSSNFDKTRSTDASVGSDNKTNTFSNTLGFDVDIGDVLVGGAVSLSKNRLGYTSGDSDGDMVKTNSKVFTLYSTVDLNWGMFNKTLVSYGSTRLHSYSDNPGYGLAQSKYKQKMTSVQTELGYNYKTSLLNYLVSGGIRYIHTDTPEHTEWGAGVMNKTTKKDTGDDFEFIGSVGVNKLIKFDKYDVIPHLTFSARKKFAGQAPGTVYIRADSPNSYSLLGQNDKKLYSQLDLGTQVKYKSSTLQLGMHYGFARKYSNIGGAIMLRLEI